MGWILEAEKEQQYANPRYELLLGKCPRLLKSTVANVAFTANLNSDQGSLVCAVLYIVARPLNNARTRYTAAR